jgi:hypothetical protein
MHKKIHGVIFASLNQLNKWIFFEARAALSFQGPSRPMFEDDL